MTSKNAAMKAGLGYTVGNVLVKGVYFLTIPLFSRIMTTDEFGVCNVFLSYDAILSVLVGLGIHTSIKSAHYEFKNTDDYTSSVTIIYMLTSLVYALLFLLGGSWLAEMLDFKPSVLFLLIPYSFSSSIVQLYNQRISLDYEYRKYLYISLVNSLGNIFFSVFFILTIYRSQRDVGRIVGTVVPIFLIAIVLLISMYSKAKPRFDKKYWKFALLYSLPIVPHGVSQVLLGQCDRIMISRMVSNSAAGIYSLAGNLKLILTVITTSIAVAWSTWFFARMKEKKENDIQESAILLVRMFLVFTVGLMALSPEIICILGDSNYELAKLVAIPMVMDAFILFLYNVIVPSEYYTKKTKYIMLGTLVAAVINLVANYICIQAFGFIAAAYTTLFSYICYLILHVAISRNLVGFDVVKIRWLFFSALVVGATGAADVFFVDSILFRYGICAVVVILLSPPLLKYLKESKERKEDSANE